MIEELVTIQDSLLYAFDKLPLTEVHKKNQEDKKRKAEEEAKQSLDDAEEIKKISSDR